MKFIFACFLLMGIAAADSAGCNFEGRRYRDGENFVILGECVQYACHNGGVSGVSCGYVSAPPHCKYIPEDNSKPYPLCCASYDCK